MGRSLVFSLEVGVSFLGLYRTLFICSVGDPLGGLWEQF
jgi:hypothetical protein